MHSGKLTNHLCQDRYGEFLLSDAVRPSADLKIVPREGYRVSVFRDPATRQRVPMLVAAVSRERLFSVAMELIEQLSPVVDVILETSHSSTSGEHDDLYREGIDLPVLQSYFYDHEDLLTNDGCTGLAVIDEGSNAEVQFDEHKLLVVYARDLTPFIEVLERWGVERDDRLRVITEAEHLHSTHPRYVEEFEQFCYHLGIAELEPHMGSLGG